MLQRIQSVFLGLSVLFTAGTYFTPIFTRAIEDPQIWIGYGLGVALAVSVIITITCIFLYKDRKNQMQWVKRAALAQVIALGFCTGVFFSLGGFGVYLWDEALGTGFVVFGFVFQLLALRFIKKDEELVRSMDRIR